MPSTGFCTSLGGDVSGGNRRFYDLSSAFELIEEEDTVIGSNYIVGQDDWHIQEEKEDSVCGFINSDVVGNNQHFSGPFGYRRIIYCDYVASGKPLKSIEDYLLSEVLPLYGNTHTTTTVTSLQTTLFRHEARDIIRNAVNASEHDAVIFAGCGCTGAVHKLINGLMLKEPPVVLHGPYEHHSNLLPWREIAAQTIRIEESKNGMVDLEMLEKELQKHQDGKTVIGCFSAVSNVTGVITQDLEITALLHKYGALAFWDYAAAAPYVKIDMNPSNSDYSLQNIKKDAIYFSMHKFVGGVQTPGILVVKKGIMKNGVPNGGGGGSVFYVTRDDHTYLKDFEMREEGGTPAIVESIRAGLAMQLKMTVTPDFIMQREEYIVKRAFSKWSSVPELQVLGSMSATRLPIFSFKIKCSSGHLLHHNFVSALLNDVFGIQGRGGCACAGPYAQDLLGIDKDLAKKYEAVLLEDSRLDRDHLRRRGEYSGFEVLRPGFCRVGIPYFFPDDLVDFVIDAIVQAARFGWMLLPQYRMNPETGEWHHRSQLSFKNRRWLGSVRFSSAGMQFKHEKEINPEIVPSPLATIQIFANEIIPNCKQSILSLPNEDLIFDSEEKKSLRWFMTSSEAVAVLEKRDIGIFVPPFTVKTYAQCKLDLFGSSLRSVVVCPVATSRDVPDDTEDQGGEFKAVTSSAKPEEPVMFTSQIKKNPAALQKSFENRRDLTDEQGRYLRTVTSFPKLEEPVTLTSQIEKDPVAIVKDRPYMPREKWPHSSDGTDLADSESKSCRKARPNNSSVGHKESSQVKASKEKQNCRSRKAGQHKRRAREEKKICNDVLDMLDGALGMMLSDEENGDAEKVCSDVSSLLSVLSDASSLLLPGWVHVPRSIMKPTIEAIHRHDMLHDNDKVLVCVSGGKDSLTLLHALHQYQQHMQSKGLVFELAAITVDPGSSSYDPSPLIPYMQRLGIVYYYEKQGILVQAVSCGEEVTSICSFCSRMKRGRIYAAARRAGFNVIAMGQHLDDLAESFLMSVFHNGRLRTMKASYWNREMDIRVIRPFVCLRERDIRYFAESNHLPVISENCPACFESPKERHRIKQLLASQEILHPQIFYSLRCALMPLMSISLPGVERQLFGKNSKNNDDSEEEIGF